VYKGRYIRFVLAHYDIDNTCNILSDKFMVVTYDRRCNSRSSGDRITDMSVAQQARDAGAIIKAMGADKAIVFGSSGGAIIGVELAAARPEVIDFLIAHEAGVIELLTEPNAEKWRSFHQDIFIKESARRLAGSST
jgi:pimeloyl-ACP methyl ester carboxylesterase